MIIIMMNQQTFDIEHEEELVHIVLEIMNEL